MSDARWRTEAPTAFAPFENSYKELYDQAPCGYFSSTPDGVIVNVNTTMLSWLGYSREDFLGKQMIDILSRGSVIFYETRYMQVLRLDGEVREVALTILRADGTAFPVLVNSLVVSEPDGTPRLVRTAIFDSTARHDYERELLEARRIAEESEARVRVLQDALIAFGESDSEEAVALSLATIARQAFAARSTSVLLLDDEGALRSVAGTPPPGILSTSFHGPDWRAITTLEVVAISTMDAAPAFPDVCTALRAARFEAMVVVPLLEDVVAVGVLLCFFGRDRSPGEHDSQLQRALGRQAAQALSRIRLQRELTQLALHDPLTGLANRQLLREHLDHALAAAARSGTAVAVIFIDLDGFKTVNDTRGHQFGDAVLTRVATRLRSAVRASDSVGRLGGDEFVIVCESTDEATASVIAERIRTSMQVPMYPEAEESAEARRLPADKTVVSASIGIAIVTPHSTDRVAAGELLAAADTAMYQSKKMGKDRVTILAL